MRIVKMSMLLLLAMSLPSIAENPGANPIIRVSGGHTSIIIHNKSPQAYRAHKEQAVRAQARLDEKRRRKLERLDEKRRREHELRVVRLKNPPKEQAVAATTEETRYFHKRRPSFFNGGYTTYDGYYGGYGYGYNGYGGYGYNGYGGYGYGHHGYGGGGYGHHGYGGGGYGHHGH